MAGSFSDFLENELLDHVFGNAAYTTPATVYVALFTANPTDAGGGTEVSAAVWTNYARLAVTNDATSFPAASGGAKTNGIDLDFGTATVTGGPVVVTGMAIFDAATLGNMLVWADLVASKSVDNGDDFLIPTGDLDITLT